MADRVISQNYTSDSITLWIKNSHTHFLAFADMWHISSKPPFFSPQNKLKRLTGWKKTNKHKSKNPSQYYPIALRLKFKLYSRAYSFFLLISIFFFSGTILQFHYLLFISEHAKPFPTSGNLHLLHIFIEILFLQLYTVLVPSFKYQFR